MEIVFFFVFQWYLREISVTFFEFSFSNFALLLFIFCFWMFPHCLWNKNISLFVAQTGNSVKKDEDRNMFLSIYFSDVTCRIVFQSFHTISEIRNFYLCLWCLEFRKYGSKHLYSMFPKKNLSNFRWKIFPQ